MENHAENTASQKPLPMHLLTLFFLLEKSLKERNQIQVLSKKMLQILFILKTDSFVSCVNIYNG